MSGKGKALVMRFLSIICWSIAPIMVRYVKAFYPVLFQGFYRYVVSLIVLWPFFLLTNGVSYAGRSMKIVSAMLPSIALIACANYIFQICFTYGLYLIHPGLATLILQSGIIFSVILSILFFPDERRTIKSWKFQLGLLMAVIGVILTIIGGRDLGKLEFNTGVLAILAAAISWSFMSSLIKKWLPDVPAILSLSSVISIVAPLLLLTQIAAGGGISLPAAPPAAWIIISASGIIGVGLGQSLFYSALPVLGLSLSASLDLIIPLLTGIGSFFVFGELLSVIQIAGGIVLLSGSYLVIRIRFKHLKNS